VADVASAPEFRCGYVAIVGRPNVGKSTLLNHLVGAKVSITSKKAQTTRHRVTGILTTGDAQFVFVDTPGFQTRHRSRLNERMNRSVTQSLGDVDAVVIVLESGRTTAADRTVIDLLPAGARVVAALNKIDRLATRDALLPHMAELTPLYPFAAIVPVSAEKEHGLDALRDALRLLLPEADAMFGADEITDRDERFLAAEFIREKIFRLLGEEIPYAATVSIDQFVQDGQMRRIHATVYVDRENQKAILLGAGGAQMKEIATKARADMERLFGGPVFLEVWVRVKRGWADDDRLLTRFGY
jgi:GTP-binding protein Era